MVTSTIVLSAMKLWIGFFIGIAIGIAHLGVPKVFRK